MHKNEVTIYFFEGDTSMTICNYYHLDFEKVTRSHFEIVILEKQEYRGGTESGLGTL
jgi:hypothetical protein